MINIITGVATSGIVVGTMSLLIILSVFNGFEGLISSLYSTFNPDIKITSSQGKYFSNSLLSDNNLLNIEGIDKLIGSLEEEALLKNGNKQYVVTLKAVQPEYANLHSTKKMIVRGSSLLQNEGNDFALSGLAVAYHLGIHNDDLNHASLSVYVPKLQSGIGMEAPFNAKKIQVSGLFSVQQDIDSKYVIVPLRYLWELTGTSNELSSIDLYVDNKSEITLIKSKIKNLLGDDFEVKDNREQEVLIYKIMKSEKLAIYFILTFIIIIATFNIIASILIIILDKKKEIKQLWNLGANQKQIKRIFYFEGTLILLIGSIVGLLLGIIICYIQQRYGVIKLGGEGAFLVDAYPIDLQFFDVLLVFITVIAIGFLSIVYPIKQTINRYVKNDFHF